jgi:dihydrofolate reductase
VDLDLVDDYRLLVHPIILGSGPPLFGDVRAERPLTLQRATTFPSGVVLLHYQRDRSA